VLSAKAGKGGGALRAPAARSAAMSVKAGTGALGRLGAGAAPAPAAGAAPVGLLDGLADVLVCAATHDGAGARLAAARLRAAGPAAAALASPAAGLQGWGALHVVAALGGCTAAGGLHAQPGLPASPADALPGDALSPGAAALATRALVDAGFEVEQASAQMGQTPLHVACAVGASAVASELLRADGPAASARLNSTDAFGHTPLHLAAGGGFRECVEVLLAAMLARSVTALAAAVDKDGRTPLGCAQAAGCARSEECIQRFLSRHLAGATVPAQEVVALADWLENTVKLPAYIDGFLAQGYTRLELWAKIGLNDQDFDLIGVRALAHRKQISHYLGKLKPESESESGSDDGSDSDDDRASSDGDQDDDDEEADE
jgi:ankyrin repeat protein